ncbi:hypothetical protein V1514DRAFT_226782 [Lipomyces japonicus]|uniref:mitochondrial 54S ribosomal protein uL11m n=1 Tax=Lipomyces japonicus TaxID=56871 RepID=UPI0034CE2A48
MSLRPFRIILSAHQASMRNRLVSHSFAEHNLNAHKFINEFNSLTATLSEDVLVPVTVTPLSSTDPNAYTFKVQTPPIAFLIMRAAGLISHEYPLSAQTFNKKKGDTRGKVSLKQVYWLAKIKQSDPLYRHFDAKDLVRSICDVCDALDIQVIE